MRLIGFVLDLLIILAIVYFALLFYKLGKEARRRKKK